MTQQLMHISHQLILMMDQHATPAYPYDTPAYAHAVQAYPYDAQAYHTSLSL